jgi:hypothetical protein
MSVKKQKSAVLNQTVFPHDLNNGVTMRMTDFAVVNRNCSFIDRNTIQKYVVMYLTKYGISKESAIQAHKSGETIDFVWRERNLKIRVVSEGESSNLVVKVFAQFYTVGYIINGYDNENLVYELSVSHMPSSILSANVGDHYATIFTGHIEELNARIEAGINRRID